MKRFEAQETIDQSPSNVWAYAAQISKHPEWMTVADAHEIQGDGTKAGARGREQLIFGPFRWDVEFEVTEALPGHRIVWRSQGDPRIDIEVSLDLQPFGTDATLATYGSSVGLRGRWRLLTPLLALEGPSGVKRELRRLKERVEIRPEGSASDPGVGG